MLGNILIRDLDSRNKPRERLLDKGAEALSDMELLAIILRSGGNDISVTNLATKLVKDHNGIKNLLEADVNELVEQKYVGNVKAVTIKAVAEVAKRAYLSETQASQIVKTPQDAFKIVKKDLFGKKQEHLYLLSLDSRKGLISKDLICIGSINETLVPIREIVRKALLKDAVNVILAHNHPSNDATPSQEDIVVTEKVAKASLVSGIYLLDHIITADNNFISIKSLNIFDGSKLENERG